MNRDCKLCLSNVILGTFFLLSSVFVQAGVSGPSSNTTGQFTATYTSAPTLHDEAKLKVISNGVLIASYTVGTSAGSRSITVSSSGSYRVEHWTRKKAGCLQGGTHGCTEPEPGIPWGLRGSFTVAVNIPKPGAISLSSSNTSGSYTISWGSASGSPNRYELQERKDGGSWSTIHSGTASSESVSGRSTGIYNYKVRACYESCSAYTSIETITVVRTPGSITLPSSSTNGSIAVSWSNVAGAANYVVEEQKNSGPWSQVYNDTATSTTVTGKGTGTYRYRVAAVENNVTGSWKTSGYVIVSRAPAVPSGLAVPSTSSSGSYGVSWDSISGATNYRLEESGASTESWTLTATSKSFNKNYEGSYSYRMRACRVYGGVTSCGGWTGKKTVEVNFPQVSGPSSNTTGRFTVSYQNSPSSVATHAQLRLSRNGNQIAAYGIGASSGTKTITVNGSGSYSVSYWWRKEEGCLQEGPNGCLEPEPGIPWTIAGSLAVSVNIPKPGAISLASRNTSGVYSIGWGAASGSPSRYELQERTDGGSWSNIHNATATAKSVSAKSTGVYDYRVRACYGGCSDFTAVKSVTVIRAPSSITAPPYADNGIYSASWAVVNGADSYELREKFNSEPYVTVYSGADTNKVFLDKGVGTYRYAVRAIENDVSGDWVYSSPFDNSVAPSTFTVPEGIDNDGAFSISWSSVPGVDTYALQQQKNSGSWTTIQNTSATSRSLNDLTTGVYKFRVASKYNSVTSTYKVSSGKTIVRTPASITTPSTVNTSGILDISWAAVSGTSDYIVQARVNAGPWTTIYTGSATSYTAVGLETADHTFRVAARYTGTRGSYKTSSTVRVVRTPTGISVPASDTNGAYTISWQGSTGVDQYVLQEQINGGSWSNVYTGTANSKVLSGRRTNTYKYRVKAQFSGNDSGYRTSGNVVVAIKPSTPSNFSVPSSSGDGSYTISWQAPETPVTEYVLEESANGGSTWVEIASQTGLSKTVNKLKNGTWHYRVKACNSYSGLSPCSAFTVSDNVTVSLPAFSSNENPSLDGEFVLTWTVGSEHYVLKQNGIEIASGGNLPTGGYRTITVESSGSYNYDLSLSNWNSEDNVWEPILPNPHHSLNVSVILVPGPPAIRWIKSNGAVSYSSKDGTFEVTAAGTGPITTVRWQLKPDGEAWPGDGVYESASGSEFNISGLDDGNYDIRIKNCNAAGCSAGWSDSESILVLREPRGDFSISVDGNFDEGEIEVSWTADSGLVDHYWLREGEGDLWGEWQDLGASRLYTPQNAKPDGNYHYEVYACNTSGCSDVVTSQSVAIDHPAPDSPSNLVAVQNGQLINLTWDKVTTGFDDYYQFRLNGETWLPTTTSEAAEQPLGNYGSHFLEVRACNVTPGDVKCSEPAGIEFDYEDPDLSTPAWAKQENLEILDAGFTDPQFEQHQNVGVIGGNGGVDGGAASYRIPVEIPPGRNGVQPEVSLSYSSRSGNGVVGKGWSVGAGSSISRCPQTIAQDGQMIPVQYLGSDRLCLDGQRLIPVSGNYGSSGTVYRMELDSFARVTQNGGLNGATTWFKVELKNGRVRYYGDDADSRHIAEGISEIKTWALSREEDRATPVNNSINYDYQGFGDGEYQLSDIYYTGSGQENGSRRISFVYESEARPDIASSYMAGGLTRQTRRLEKIAVYYQAELIREYRLSYKLSEATGSSLLEQLLLCESGGQCLEPTKFEWADNAEVKQKELLGSASYSGDNYLNSGKTVSETLFPDERHIDRLIPRGDFNGDGVRDWPGYFMSAEGEVTGTFNPETEGCTPFPGSIRCVELDANNDGKSDTWRKQSNQLQIGISDGTGDFSWISTPIPLPGTDHVIDANDYNGDGWVDLQIRRGDSISDNELYLYLHTGNTSAPYANNGQLVTTFHFSSSKWIHRSSVEFIGDVTGNGLPDLLLYDSTILVNGVGEVTAPQPTPKTFLFAKRNGSGVTFVPVATETPQNNLDGQLSFYYLLDINGDGLADWISWRGIDNGVYYRLNKGGVFTAWQFAELDTPLETRFYRYFNETDQSPEPLRGLKYVNAIKKYDRGANGKMGLIYPSLRLIESCMEVYVAGGLTELCGDDLYEPFNSGTAGNPTYENFDVTQVDHSVYSFKGLDFVEQPDGGFTIEQYGTGIAGTAYNSAVIDAFGNGLSDFIFSYGCANFPGDCSVPDDESYSPGVYIRRNRGSSTGDELYEPTDMLVAVENSLNFRDEWHYRPLSSRDDRYHTTDKPFYERGGYLDSLPSTVQDNHFEFTSSMYVVAEHRQSNGIGDSLNRKQYRYKGAVFNSKGRGFQGFHTIIEEDFAANIETQSDFHQIFPLAGRLHRQRKWELGDRESDDDNASPFEESSFEWQFWPNGGDGSPIVVTELDQSWAVSANEPYFVGPHEQRTVHRTLGESQGTRTELYTNTRTSRFDQWGNVTLTTSRYEEAGSAHIASSTTETLYADADETNWWLNKPSSQTVTKHAVQSRNGVEIEPDTDVEQSVEVTYESWDGDARKPTSVLTEPSSGKWTRVTTQYTEYGLPELVTTTAAGETESRFVEIVEFSSDGYFPKVVQNALDHTVTTITNPRFGKPDSVTDTNDLTTSYEYDAFGRPITETAPSALGLKAAPDAHIALQWCNPCDSAPDAVYKTIRQQAGTPTQITYHDMLGRVIRTEVQAFDSADWVVTKTEYNELGQVTFESVPHYASSPNSYGTRYDGYDTLGRALGKTVDQTNSQVLDIDYTHEYQGSFQTQITANGRIMYRTYNGLQQLTQTIDALTGTTQYAYDGAGNPIVLQDAATNRITAKYNALGQKEWVNDPNMGEKAFTYTGFGEVETETDGNLDITSYTYDRLGQIKTRSVNGILEAEWTYGASDTAPNGIGLPLTERKVDGSHTRTYHYDSLSRPDRITITIDGEDFLTVNHYDSNYGRLKGLSYPSGLTLQYGYNDAGYQFRTTNAASGYTYREITQMDAWGEWSEASLAASNYTTTRGFFAETGQMELTQFDNAAGLYHQLLGYTYDGFGNLETKMVDVPSLSPSSNLETYGYDALNRLDYSSRTDGPTIDYDYDPIGNLLKKDDFATSYSYIGGTSGGPSAVKSVTLTDGGTMTYCYDANGNRIGETAGESCSPGSHQNIWYNAFNKPIQIVRNGVDLRFSYGADQMRYKQVDQTSNKTTIYVDKLFERITEGETTQYRHFIGDIAVVTTAETSSDTTHTIGFTHRDRLGSTVAIGDQSGNLQETHSFDPFGKPRLGNILDKTLAILDSAFTTRGFTDHEHLDSVELIHMNGRAYDYNLGRFLSVDPIIQSPGNSQSLNPYSYIMNNPLAGTDPTGYLGAGDMLEYGLLAMENAEAANQAVQVANNGISHTKFEQAVAKAVDLMLLEDRDNVSENGGSDPVKGQSVENSELSNLSDPSFFKNAIYGEQFTDDPIQLADNRITVQGSCSIPMACAGSLASGSGALLGFTGYALETGRLGRIGVTSAGNLKYSAMGWGGNQYVNMRNIAEFGKGLTPLAFGLESYGNYISWTNGGSNSEFATDQTMTIIGLRFPLIGASYTLAPIVGPHVLDAAIKIGPKPSISPPGRYDDLQKAIDDMYLD